MTVGVVEVVVVLAVVEDEEERSRGGGGCVVVVGEGSGRREGNEEKGRGVVGVKWRVDDLGGIGYIWGPPFCV